MDLLSCQCLDLFINIALLYNLKSGRIILLAVFQLLRFPLDTLVLLILKCILLLPFQFMWKFAFKFWYGLHCHYRLFMIRWSFPQYLSYQYMSLRGISIFLLSFLISFFFVQVHLHSISPFGPWLYLFHRSLCLGLLFVCFETTMNKM